MINSPTAPAVTESAYPLAQFHPRTSATAGAVKVLMFDTHRFKAQSGTSPPSDLIFIHLSLGKRAIVTTLLTRDMQLAFVEALRSDWNRENRFSFHRLKLQSKTHKTKEKPQ